MSHPGRTRGLTARGLRAQRRSRGTREGCAPRGAGVGPAASAAAAPDPRRDRRRPPPNAHSHPRAASAPRLRALGAREHLARGRRRPRGRGPGATPAHGAGPASVPRREGGVRVRHGAGEGRAPNEGGGPAAERRGAQAEEEKRAPRARTGRQENHAGGPATPGTPAGPQPPDLEPPRGPAPPTGTPQPRAVLAARTASRPSGHPVRHDSGTHVPGGATPPPPQPRTWRPPKAPSARAANPPAAARDGSGRRACRGRAARPWLTRNPLGPATREPHTRPRRTQLPRDGRRPGPAGPSPASVGGGAGRGRQSIFPLGPQTEGARAHGKEGGRSWRPPRAEEGQQLGGPVPQGTLSDR